VSPTCGPHGWEGASGTASDGSDDHAACSSSAEPVPMPARPAQGCPPEALHPQGCGGVWIRSGRLHRIVRVYSGGDARRLREPRRASHRRSEIRVRFLPPLEGALELAPSPYKRSRATERGGNGAVTCRWWAGAPRQPVPYAGAGAGGGVAGGCADHGRSATGGQGTARSDR
jgi:hypothetical protein